MADLYLKSVGMKRRELSSEFPDPSDLTRLHQHEDFEVSLFLTSSGDTSKLTNEMILKMIIDKIGNPV